MFGAKPTAGFNLPATPSTSTATTGGFSFGATTGQPSGGGFSFSTPGQTAQTTAASTVTFNFGNTTTGTGGFKLGGTGGTSAGFGTTTTTSSLSTLASSATSAPAAGFSLPFTSTQASTVKFGTATPAATSGFTPGGTTTTSAAPGFSLGGTTTTSAASGFSLGGTTTTSGTAGFNLTGATSTAPTLGAVRPTLSLAATTSGGFAGFGGNLAATSKPSTGLLGAGFAANTTSTTGLTTGGSIFGTPSTKSQSQGLGGVDPKTSTSSAGGSSSDAKAGDGKTLKKSQIPPDIVNTVREFKKYVKDEKSVQEGISRMSTKPMYKVQEDVAALKQLLSVVSNGLHRNACAVEKLKKEMTQELKNAEMSQRTKDIPAGLQYENTAPTEYFQKLVEDFENQMLSYRQQIETLEGHLASLNEPSRLSPEELIGLLRKLHETFIALAAQLHQVHEAVKTQKEHYLNYRKIFLHDTKNIFDREKKAAVKSRPQSEQFGPSPFTGLSNAAAVAMASALTKSQQPATAPPVAGLGGTLGQTTGGFGSTGLFGATTSAVPAFGFGGLGTATTTSSSFTGFGTGTTTTQSTGFGFGAKTAAVQPLGFGTTTTAGIFGMSQPSQIAPVFGTASPQQNFGSTGGDQPFQLNKPPGNKRGKR